jgi:hypothetical protein
VSGLETVAPADGRNDQVQVRVLGVSAFFYQIFRRLVAAADFYELPLVILVVLAKVGTETALTVVNVCHNS